MDLINIPCFKGMKGTGDAGIMPATTAGIALAKVLLSAMSSAHLPQPQGCSSAQRGIWDGLGARGVPIADEGSVLPAGSVCTYLTRSCEIKAALSHRTQCFCARALREPHSHSPPLNSVGWQSSQGEESSTALCICLVFFVGSPAPRPAPLRSSSSSSLTEPGLQSCPSE